jgi:hypothetical protein
MTRRQRPRPRAVNWEAVGWLSANVLALAAIAAALVSCWRAP